VVGGAAAGAVGHLGTAGDDAVGGGGVLGDDIGGGGRDEGGDGEGTHFDGFFEKSFEKLGKSCRKSKGPTGRELLELVVNERTTEVN
jgi:hypothetical protein